MPERVPLMQIDAVGGYSAACGSLVYEGGAWPAEWERALFCTEPILDIIHSEKLRPARRHLHRRNGAARGGMPALARLLVPPDRRHASARTARMYVVDFYNPVVSHSDSRGPQHSKAGAAVRPDREHYFGRIYRIQHKQAKTLAVPDLTRAALPELVQALRHPNRVVRHNAHRLIMERGAEEVAQALEPLAGPAEKSTSARILALWALHRLGALPAETLREAVRSRDPAVRKNAAFIAEGRPADVSLEDITEGLADAEPRTRLALLAVLPTKMTRPGAEALVALFPKLTGDVSKSAAVAASSLAQGTVLDCALEAKQPDRLTELVRSVTDRVVETHGEDVIVQAVRTLPAKPARADALKLLVLEAAARMDVRPSAPAIRGGSPEHPTSALMSLGELLASPDRELATAALSVAAKWDKRGVLKEDIKRVAGELLAELEDAKALPARRAQIAAALIDARAANPEILNAIRRLLKDQGVPDEVKRRAVSALGAGDDRAPGQVLVETFPALPQALQTPAFDLLLARPEWTGAFLQAIAAEKLKISTLGPANIFRLRTHPNKEIAERATAMLSKLVKTNTDKDKLIEQLTPVVTQPGNAANGKALFAAACATCHVFDGEGKAIGPVLTGIGAHGPEQLLVSIVDPNRVIDAGYETYNVATMDGQLQSGILASENEARLVLRGPAGDLEVPKTRIKSSENTHRSLMPEGFEGLGAEALRDILTYLCGEQSRYRVLDLSQAFTADTRRGLYASQEKTRDTVSFKQFGIVTVEGIPFHLANPEASALGGNVIVLRGGPPDSFAKTLPARVEVPVNLPAKAFHVLGGIAGWGANKADPEGRPIMKATLQFADGQSETVTFRNGVEFSDYIRPIDVPGSRLAEGVVKERQIRWFTIPVKRAGMVKSLVLESFEHGPAPTTAAITAELRAP